jgi:hypothetical protein
VSRTSHAERRHARRDRSCRHLPCRLFDLRGVALTLSRSAEFLDPNAPI